MSLEKISYTQRLIGSHKKSGEMSPAGQEHQNNSRKAKKAARRLSRQGSDVREIEAYAAGKFTASVGQLREGQATISESLYVSDHLSRFEQEITGGIVIPVEDSSDAA